MKAFLNNHHNYLLYMCFLFTFGISACEETTTDPPKFETGTIIDFDSNVYQTIKIGDQWWMAENLRVTHFRNGKPLHYIPDVMDSLNWTSYPSYCHYESNPSAPGLLYNWGVIADSSGIAPEGWHVPTDEDWKKLEKYLGMATADIEKTNWRGTHEGEKIKMSGPNYWVIYEEIWNTNETGFSAMAGGCRMFNHQWSYPIGMTYMGFWWTSSPTGDQMAWYRHLDYKTGGIFRYYGSQNYGFSIRCVKD